MATIQQSIDIKAPVHAVYTRLTRFEDYPRFMEEVEAVQRIDDRHLHWTTIMANRPVEWDAEITEDEPDRCIAWHNTSGPTNAGKVELQPVDAGTSRVTFTVRSEPEQVPGSMAGNHEDEMARRLRLDLVHLKDFIEPPGSGAQAATGGAPEAASSSPGYAAGSEGFSGDEDTSQPVTHPTGAEEKRTAAEQRNDSAGSVSPGQLQTQSQGQQSQSQSQSQLPPNAAQAGSMRHVGQMPQDTSTEGRNESPASDATGKSMLQDGHTAQDEARLKQSMDRAVPPSE